MCWNWRLYTQLTWRWKQWREWRGWWWWGRCWGRWRGRWWEACKFSRGAGYCTGVRQGGPRRHHHHLVRHYYIHHHPCCQFIFFDVDFKTQWPPMVTVMNNTNHHHCLSFIMIHHDSLSFIIIYHDHWTHALPKTDICQYQCRKLLSNWEKIEHALQKLVSILISAWFFLARPSIDGLMNSWNFTKVMSRNMIKAMDDSNCIDSLK